MKNEYIKSQCSCVWQGKLNEQCKWHINGTKLEQIGKCV